MSLRNVARISDCVSAFNFATLGSTLSIRAFVRCGKAAALSAASFAEFGSSVSLRSFVRVGSSASLYQ